MGRSREITHRKPDQPTRPPLSLALQNGRAIIRDFRFDSIKPRPLTTALLTVDPKHVRPGTRAELLRKVPKTSPTTGAVIGEDRQPVGGCVVTFTEAEVQGSGTVPNVVCASRDQLPEQPTGYLYSLKSYHDGSSVEGQVAKVATSPDANLLAIFNRLRSDPEPSRADTESGDPAAIERTRALLEQLEAACVGNNVKALKKSLAKRVASCNDTEFWGSLNAKQATGALCKAEGSKPTGAYVLCHENGCLTVFRGDHLCVDKKGLVAGIGGAAQ